MKRKSMVFRITTIAVLFTVTACSNPDQQNNTEQVSGTSIQAKLPADLKFNDDKLNAIYPWYLELHEALVIEDLSAAKNAAFAIEEGSRQLDANTELTNTASKIVAAPDIASQREVFQTLTKLIIDEVKSTGLESGELFVAHCPMAFDHKGADWLSTTEEIRNPYYGDEMLTCGSVKETI
jgi:hypothetical protein